MIGFFPTEWSYLSPINLKFKALFINRLSLMCDSITKVHQDVYFPFKAANLFDMETFTSCPFSVQLCYAVKLGMFCFVCVSSA